ncbi:MAG: hypothetical protein ACLFQ8_03280 [Candidatus Aenigmatarchaeota archaeon]
MTEKGPDDEDKKGIMKFMQKKKAVAGVVLLLAASFGTLLTFTEQTSQVTGYFLTEEDETLVEELQEYEEMNEETLGSWIEEKIEEGYTEEEVREALADVGKDPGLVDEFVEE